MKKIIAMVMLVCLVLAGCGAENQEAVELKDGATVGSGSTTFQLVITDGDENEMHVNVKTNEKLLGDALQELKIISGEESNYGLYVTTVNGIYADYDNDKTYWALYIDDKYAEESISKVTVTEDAVYSLKLEKVM